MERIYDTLSKVFVEWLLRRNVSSLYATLSNTSLGQKFSPGFGCQIQSYMPSWILFVSCVYHMMAEMLKEITKVHRAMFPPEMWNKYDRAKEDDL